MLWTHHGAHLKITLYIVQCLQHRSWCNDINKNMTHSWSLFPFFTFRLGFLFLHCKRECMRLPVHVCACIFLHSFSHSLVRSVCFFSVSPIYTFTIIIILSSFNNRNIAAHRKVNIYFTLSISNFLSLLLWEGIQFVWLFSFFLRLLLLNGPIACVLNSHFGMQLKWNKKDKNELTVAGVVRVSAD